MSKSSGLVAMKRYAAMQKRVEAKPVRTLGYLFTLRLAVLSDIQVMSDQRDRLLNRIYGGLAGPPEDGKWNSYPTHRRMFFIRPLRPERVHSISFGWSFVEPGIEGRRRGWTMSWSADWFKGYGDPRLIREVVGRDPKNEIDELVCAGLVAEALEANDEELVRAFADVQHRIEQLWQRHRVVRSSIEHSLLKILAKEHDWRPGRGEPWRKVTFEDGTVVTLTGDGVVMFEDAVATTHISLQSPAGRRETWPHNLSDRQRRALERR